MTKERIGNYEILSECGRGALSRVLEVVDSRSGTVCALKQALSESEACRWHLVQEFETLSRLSHPNIIRVLDCGTSDDGRFYFTMEYVEGVPVTQALQGYSKNLVHVIGQLLDALIYIHSQGLVHGDIKPTNILVAKDASASDPLPRALLTDFGFSHHPIADYHDRLGGTIGYAAPELLRGEQLDGRADLYSLGLVIYQILTGRIPYRADRPIEVLREQFTEDLDPPRSIAPDVSSDVDQLIERLIARRACDRVSCAEEARALLSPDHPDRARPTIRSGVVWRLALPFVGRTEERAKVHELYQLACQGKGQVVLVKGCRGIGKSRLLREIAVELQLQGARVVSVSFTGSALDSLEAIQRRWGRSPSSGRGEISPGDDRGTMRLFRHMLDDLTAGTHARPKASRAMVLIIDDAHLADRSSREFLRYMLHSIRQRHILALLAAGSDEALERTFTTNDQDTTLTTIHLDPLSRIETVSLVSQALGAHVQGDEIYDAVYDETRGNPLLIRDRLAAADGTTGTPLPATRPILSEVADKIGDTIAALPGLERGILAVAALAPGRTSIGLLTAVLDQAPGPLLEALSVLERKHILTATRTETSGPPIYEFDDRTSRDVASELVSSEERQHIHARIAGYLSELPSSEEATVAADIAYHLLQAGRDVEARPHARRAGYSALQYGDRHAAARYLAASLPPGHGERPTDEECSTISLLVELYEKLGQPLEAAEWQQRLVDTRRRDQDLPALPELERLELRMASLLRAAGRYDEALTHLYSVAQADDPVLRARASAERARIHGLTGQIEMATTAGDEALALLNSIEDPGERSAVLHAGAIAHWRARNTEKALILCDRGLASASRSSDEEMEARLWGLRSILLGETGAFEEALTSHETTLRLQRQIGDVRGEMLTYYNLGRLAQDRGDWPEAVRYFKGALPIAERVGDASMTAKICHAYAVVKKEQGEWPEAARLLEQSADLYRHLGEQADWASCLDSLALIRAGQGEVDEAFALLQQGMELRERSSGRSSLGFSHQKFGQLYLEREQFQEAKKYLSRALKSFDAQGISNKAAGTAILLAETNIRLGHLVAARRLIDRALRLWGDACPDLDRGDAHRVQALLAAERRRTEEARHHFDESIRILRNLGARPLLAKTLTQVARWLLEEHLARAGTSRDERGVARAQPLSPKTHEYLKEVRTIYTSMDAKLYWSALDGLVDSAFDLLGPGGPAVHDQDRLMRAFSEFGQIIQRIDDRQALLTELLDRLIELLRAERGALFVCRSDLDTPFMAVGRNMDSVSVDDASKLSRQAVRAATATSRLIVVGDAENDPSWKDYPSIRLNHIRSLLCAPLIVGGSVKGALYLDSSLEADLFTEDAQSFVAGLAALVGGVLDASDLYERTLRENVQLRSQLGKPHAFRDIIGESPALAQALQLAERVASTDVVILVQGETGTGKDLLAQAIHNCSSRRDGPFLRVDCGALPETLLQSELFGHAKGAFTGAHRQRNGLIRQADGGTLFLDEIGNAPESVQRMLLTVLESGEVRSIGDDAWKKVDVRIICATNQDLAARAAGNRFRQDLFYRISGVTVELPRLCERGMDILLLAEHFVELAAKQLNRNVRRFDSSVQSCLTQHSWPGNVRELQNCVQRAVAVCRGEIIHLEDLDPRIIGSVWEGSNLDEARRLVESDRAERALALTKGNVTKAAKILNISRRQMQRIMKKHGITRFGHSQERVAQHDAGDRIM